MCLEIIGVKLRDFLFAFCLVALVAVGVRQASSFRSGDSSSPEPQIEVAQVLEHQRAESLREPDYGAVSAPSPRPVDTGFRIRKITTSALSDSTDCQEQAAIAGYVVEDPSQPGTHLVMDEEQSISVDEVTSINSRPVSVGELEVDGLAWAVYEEHWLKVLLGEPQHIGTAESAGLQYLRWSWPGRRDLILRKSARGSGYFPVKIQGATLAVDGHIVLEIGDPREKAEKVLGMELGKSWADDGTDHEITVHAEILEGRVRTVTLQVAEVIPEVPLE